MKIKFRIIIITVLLLIFSFSYVNAIDMFLNTVNSNIISNENTSELNNTTDLNTNEIAESEENISNTSTTITNPAPTVTHSSTASEGTLSTSDIIDIILISVCIVLVFLGIAILIRCK